MAIAATAAGKAAVRARATDATESRLSCIRLDVAEWDLRRAQFQSFDGGHLSYPKACSLEHDPHRAEQQLATRRAVDLGETPERKLEPD
jgi:hypothetical protein